MRISRRLSLATLLTVAASCGEAPDQGTLASEETPVNADAIAVESAIPADRLRALKAALPKVAWPRLKQIFESPQTFWYDHESMKPSYQAALTRSPPYGANANDDWMTLVAGSVKPAGRDFYDESKRRWRFPFSTTAGTDQSDNLKVINFLWLPAKDGKLLPLAPTEKRQAVPPFADATTNSWGWTYPVGAMVGEILFVKTPAGELLPSEIRIRMRQASGWSSNAFRPFPTAASLAAAIKARRPSWQESQTLSRLVAHLDDDRTLVSKTLSASQLPGVFEQSGAVDVLPDFGDDALVKELLTQTPFISSFGQTWKQSDRLQSFAPSTTAAVSIVPRNYDAGVIAVDDDSCMRCHKETGRPLATFGGRSSSMLLYGEIWGRDGIFSFHPFDESLYRNFWNTSAGRDNRRLNPKLRAAGIVAPFDASTHRPPAYPAAEIVGGPGGNSGSTPPPSNPPPSNPPPSEPPPSNPPPTEPNPGADPSIVEFRIPAGTGRGEWNLQNAPLVVRPGQTVRIINDDTTQHTLHTDGRPCPHGNTARPLRTGDRYDCRIPANTPRGTVFMLWDHFLGGPSSGRFWVRVE